MKSAVGGVRPCAPVKSRCVCVLTNPGTIAASPQSKFGARAPRGSTAAMRSPATDISPPSNGGPAPGNAGTAADGVNVPIESHEFDKLIRFAKKEKVGLTVIGPEDPLARGVVDAFQAAGLKVFGPSKAAARVEASKVFAKQLMRHADVPTSEFRVFDHPEPARTFVETREYPVVVKADGLAAGKGVIVCKDTAEALRAVERVMVRDEFGARAGRRIVVEKKLDGEELSLLALVSGRSIFLLPPTQDHKAVFDG